MADAIRRHAQPHPWLVPHWVQTPQFEQVMPMQAVPRAVLMTNFSSGTPYCSEIEVTVAIPRRG
jgi:hypothetical protein